MQLIRDSNDFTYLLGFNVTYTLPGSDKRYWHCFSCDSVVGTTNGAINPNDDEEKFMASANITRSVGLFFEDYDMGMLLDPIEWQKYREDFEGFVFYDGSGGDGWEFSAHGMLK